MNIMNIPKFVFLLSLVVFPSSDVLAQKENSLDKWLKIKVFITTRDEVEKLYGVGEKGLLNEYFVIYQDSESIIYVTYASGDCKASKTNLWNVPAWTVTEVMYAAIKHPPKLKRLISSNGQFKSRESWHVPEHIEYYDDERGITIIYSTTERRVLDIIIRPSLKASQENDCNLIQ